jgi:hypothetical protein
METIFWCRRGKLLIKQLPGEPTSGGGIELVYSDFHKSDRLMSYTESGAQ